MVLVSPLDKRGRPLPVRVRRPSERRSVSRSATRALDILEMFGDLRRPLRACEIAEALGTSPSSTNQLLKTMVDSAHLLFDVQLRTYVPSQRFAAFSGWINATYGTDASHRRLVRQVHAATGLTVTLTVANDLFMQIVELAGPEDAVTERGQQVAMFGSVIGSAFLASIDEREVRRLARRARFPDADVPALLRTLATIAADGFADGSIAVTDGANDIWSLAFALPPGTAPAHLVLGVAGPAALVRSGSAALAARLHDRIAAWTAAGSASAEACP